MGMYIDLEMGLNLFKHSHYEPILIMSPIAHGLNQYPMTQYMDNGPYIECTYA